MPGIFSVTLPTISLRYAALNVKTVTILFSSLYYSSEYILSFLLPRCYQDRTTQPHQPLAQNFMSIFA